MNLSKEKIRKVLAYEFSKGRKVGAAVKNMRNVFGSGSVSVVTAKQWFAKFCKGEFDVKDQHRSRRPSRTKGLVCMVYYKRIYLSILILWVKMMG